MAKNKIYLLAIESSCDDTGAAVLENGRVLSNITASQAVHEMYGGVIPELASRQHITGIIPVIDLALKDAGIQKDDLSVIAFTRGPGLLGSLMVGVSVAKAMALSLGIPLIDVHHMQAHVLAHFASDPKPDFPFLCLTVSGGHTQIVRVNSFNDMEVLGQTLDDAAGEAFDKVGKMLGLPYPAGPVIDKQAQKGEARFTFPEPQVKGLDMSFSGLKTSVLYFLQAEMARNPAFINENLVDLCCSLQTTVVRYLLSKLEQATKETGITQVGIAGGVSANSYLRQQLKEMGDKKGWVTFIPPFSLCTDNAGMIGVAGYYKYLSGQFCGLDVAPDARMEW